MGEGLVGLGHLVHVFLPLECAAFVVVSGDDFGTKFFCHRAAGAFAGEGYHILHGERNLPLRAQLGRHLEVGAADTAGLDSCAKEVAQTSSMAAATMISFFIK